MEKQKVIHRISLDNGKYKIYYDSTGSYPLEATRYDEHCRHLSGDNIIFFLCAKIEELQEALYELNADVATKLSCIEYK